MRVGVIDVGANTLRLLVATTDGGRVIGVHTEKVQLGLGEHVEAEGRLPRSAIDAATKAARREVETARRKGAVRTEIVVTSPGRQASNGHALAAALAAIPGAGARILSAEEEGRFAYFGALATVEYTRDTVAVCDVGGGSLQVVVGERTAGPVWLRSLDVGSLRLAKRVLDGGVPVPSSVRALRVEAARAFSDLTPPLPLTAIAAGGTARALRRVVGAVLDAEALNRAVALLAERDAKWVAKEWGISRARARTLLAGAVLFAEAQRRLGLALHVSNGGLREGVALELAAVAATAA